MKKLSLTFDNGPSPGITEPVLEVLQSFGVKATFFLVGTQLENSEGRRIAERALAAGHRLGNHTYSHGDPLGLRDKTAAAAEIGQMHALMGDLVGERPLFRPNGRGKMGHHLLSPEAVTELKAIRSTVVLWNSVPRDRQVVVDRPDVWVDDALRAVEEIPWPLIVLHDRPSGFPLPGPMAHLPVFLEAVIGKVEFTPDFPPSCTPIVEGREQPDLAAYVDYSRLA